MIEIKIFNLKSLFEMIIDKILIWMDCENDNTKKEQPEIETGLKTKWLDY